MLVFCVLRNLIIACIVASRHLRNSSYTRRTVSPLKAEVRGLGIVVINNTFMMKIVQAVGR